MIRIRLISPISEKKEFQWGQTADRADNLDRVITGCRKIKLYLHRDLREGRRQDQVDNSIRRRRMCRRPQTSSTQGVLTENPVLLKALLKEQMEVNNNSKV